jgi:predicted TIM-barrel fold metal-dependent hydrolase
MIVDVHTHLGKWTYPTRVLSAEDMAVYMQRYGIRYSIISSSLAVVYDFHEGNQELADMIRGHRQLLAYVTVNLNYLDASLVELEHYFGSRRAPDSQFVGIKVHQNMTQHRFNTPEGMAVARAAAGYGVPILVHTFSSALESPWNVGPAAKANPTLQIILAHMGGDTWWEGIRAAGDTPNLYCEICSTWTDPPKMRAAIDALGAKRILFGTDATLFDAAHMLGAVDDAGLSDEERSLVMGENARHLFHLME